ncbi:Fe-S cluster assembly ATPase SufC [Candidatus Peregrinibacteria bacterium]|nr:Fe-S cluster assembly ATPase SufC [Candidatus Peregrinibacteria bacterium]
MSKLKISDLKVNVDGKEILKGVNLEINTGEIHAVMGPNGSGKSTLCYAIMGHPKYEIVSGSVELDGENLLELPTHKRAKLGLFLGFQYPQEIPGVTFGNFLRQAHNLKTGEEISLGNYYKKAQELLENLNIHKKFIGRGVNEGFSGGEKKKAEIAQLTALKPKLALLDEIDSGLDIDSLKDVANGINKAYQELGTGLLLITHYQRLLHHIKATNVHVMKHGKIVKSGGMELVELLEKDGYHAI